MNKADSRYTGYNNSSSRYYAYTFLPFLLFPGNRKIPKPINIFKQSSPLFCNGHACNLLFKGYILTFSAIRNSGIFIYRACSRYIYLEEKYTFKYSFGHSLLYAAYTVCICLIYIFIFARIYF